MNLLCRSASGLSALGASIAYAHHPFESEFGIHGPVTLVATGSSVTWTDPHVMISATVSSERGKTEAWKLEAGSPAEMKRYGWDKAMLQKGTRITVSAYLALGEAHTASARSIKLADGKELAVAAYDGGPPR